MIQAETPICREHIETIWQAYDLGALTAVTTPKRGSVNLCFLVNGDLVLRFQVRDLQFAKLRSEKIAYDLLRSSELPVPKALVLDETKTLAPYDFLITTRIPGEAVSDSWGALERTVRDKVAFDAGRYQAVMHRHELERFGSLSDLAEGGFPMWTAYLEDYFEKYARLARDLDLLDSGTVARIAQLLGRLRPLFTKVTTASLLHSDYHFENILQHEGEITGIIDFEWALSGDPVFDCRIDTTLEEMCPGSVESFYAGYESISPLAVHHVLKARVYALLLHLESVAAWKTDPPGEWYHEEYRKLFDELAALEQEV